MRSALVGGDSKAAVGFVGQAAFQQNALAHLGDLPGGVVQAGFFLCVAQCLGPFALSHQRFHAPAPGVPPRAWLGGNQREHFIVAAGRQHGGQAGAGAFEVPAPRCSGAPNALQGGQQFVYPLRGQLGPGAQFTPKVAQVFQVRHLVLVQRFPELLHPLLAQGRRSRGSRYHRHQCFNGPVDPGPERAGGAVHVHQCG